jgi:hypothetical protein
MVATEGRRGAVTRIPWRVIERAQWVAIQVDGMNGRLAGRMLQVLEQASGVLTVQAEADARVVVITFDPLVTAPGALADIVARVADNVDSATTATVTAMRTGSLPHADPVVP